MHYRSLLYMTVLSFISMYILMYMMVDKLANVYTNINQLYMAGLMTVPMVVFELLIMRHMYTNNRLNTIIYALSVGAFIFFMFGIRRQFGVNDKEFLKSMIPHHAAALLMCEQTQLQDPELQKLCETIHKGQQSEIDFMKSKLKGIF